MVIEAHFDLWNHFFHARLPQGLGAEAAVLGDDLGTESIPTSTAPYLVLRMGGRKYSSFYGMTLTCRSPCSQVAASSPNKTWGMKWPEGTSTVLNQCGRSFNSYSTEG
jgi:hypothetical protein